VSAEHGILHHLEIGAFGDGSTDQVRIGVEDSPAISVHDSNVVDHRPSADDRFQHLVQIKVSRQLVEKRQGKMRYTIKTSIPMNHTDWKSSGHGLILKRL